MRYTDYLKDKILSRLKKLWGTVYFSFDKYNEFDKNLDNYIDEGDIEYFYSNLYKHFDNIFGENLYRFSSRKIINEITKEYNNFYFTERECKYNDYDSRSNQYNGSFCIRLAYFIPNKKLLEIGQNIIKLVYNTIIQLIIDENNIKNIKSAKVYKIQNISSMVEQYHTKSDIKNETWDMPATIIDTYDKKELKSLIKFYNVDQIFHINDGYDIYYFNKNDIEINSILNGFSNKLFIYNLFKNFAIEIIDDNNQKYLCILKGIRGLYLCKSNLKVSEFNQLYNEYLRNKLNNCNISSVINGSLINLNKIYIDIENDSEIRLYNHLTNSENEIDEITNNLDYAKCDTLEDFMTQFQYYLSSLKYINDFRLKEIYSWKV